MADSVAGMGGGVSTCRDDTGLKPAQGSPLRSQADPLRSTPPHTERGLGEEAQGGVVGLSVEGCYLHLDASRPNEEQRVSVPDVDLQRLSSQVADEPAPLAWLQEAGIHHVPQLEAGRAWTEKALVSL